MRHPITPKAHGVIDYTTSSAVAMAPMAIDMPKRAEAACYALAAGYTALSMMTKYPAGARKMVPFKGHGATELMIGAALPFLPRMMGIKNSRLSRKQKQKEVRNAKLLFCGLAAFTGVVAVMTDWGYTPEARGQIGRSVRS